MDAQEVERLARIVEGKTRRKYWYYSPDMIDALVSEAYDLLLQSVRLHPERTAKQHENASTRSPAKKYHCGMGREMFQTTREAAARKPGRREALPTGERF